MTHVPHTSRGVLTFRDEDDRVTRIEFKGRALVGRDPACTVVLKSRAASRHHALLEHDDEGWRLRDLNSGNGTQVNRKSVLASAIAPGDEIVFGELAAKFENLPEEPPSKLEETARLLTRTFRIKPTRKARPVAALVATVAGFALLLAASAAERACLHRGGAATADVPPR